MIRGAVSHTNVDLQLVIIDGWTYKEHYEECNFTFSKLSDFFQDLRPVEDESMQFAHVFVNFSLADVLLIPTEKNKYS